MSGLKKYEIMILLPGKFNDDQLKNWAFHYSKNLRKFNACDISVISHGKHNLAYPIYNNKKGNYIQLNFSSIPKYVINFINLLKTNADVLRFLVTCKEKRM